MKSISLLQIGVSVIVILVIIFTVFSFKKKNREHGCELVMPINQSQAVIDRLDNDTSSFASSTIDLMGRSAEGGLQTNYTNGQVRQVVEQRFYGETGRSYMKFYYSKNKLFAIVKLNLTYAAPLSVDNSGTVESSEERDYFLDQNGQVCNAFVNHISQPVDKDTQDMIAEYINGII